MTALLARNRYDVFDLFHDLAAGETSAWITLGVIVTIIAGLAAYQKLTGHRILNRKERRRKRRGKHVVWEYHRDG